MTEIADILQRIVEQRRIRVAEAMESSPVPTSLAEDSQAPMASGAQFLEALRSSPGRAVIAEIKLGSPRMGSLTGTLDPERQARLYAENGAAAMSVVVEPDFFHGSYELLSRCRQAANLPALAKDFIVDPIQIDWARRSGASAVLLIAALYSHRQLLDLAAEARHRGLVPLVECHSPKDLQKLGGGEWELVGINNRDLRTFEVDLDRSVTLLADLPDGSMKIAESGMHSVADVSRLAAAGFDAFLIGESLLLAADPGAVLRGLVGGEESD